MELKTPLYDLHKKYHGKMVAFAGYLLPVQYKAGIIAEHMAVRNACGMFDVSHLGEITCTGPDAVKNLNHLLTNDYTAMNVGQARYSPMCNEDGGVVDGMIVYKEKEAQYLLVVNAANREKDYIWMKEHAFGQVEFKDISSEVAQIALQGPKALQILKKVVREKDIPTSYYTALFDRKIMDMTCMISRTGYTGEDGFEIYLAPKDAPELWELLMDAGKDEGLIPCGLGARDTLRLEAAMPLYGREVDDSISPLEAGLQAYVKMNKENFIGKDPLQSLALKRRRVGLKITGAGIAREHYQVYADGKNVGVITSGTHSPYLDFPIAMALLEISYNDIGKRVEVDIRGRRVQAEVVSLPFYKKGQGK